METTARLFSTWLIVSSTFLIYPWRSLQPEFAGHFEPQYRNTLFVIHYDTGGDNRDRQTESGGQDEVMPHSYTNLGYVLCHIYDIDFGAAVYLPNVERYEADTPCIVASATTHTDAEEAALHQACLDHGFKNWLNVAVVSDTCDTVSEQTEACLIAAFNDDCQEGGWLRKMMNYRTSDLYPEAT